MNVHTSLLKAKKPPYEPLLYLLPFLIPVAVRAGTTLFEPVHFGSNHTLIWTVAAWAFLPASLFMRGIAMHRVADMIAERRRRGAPAARSAVAA